MDMHFNDTQPALRTGDIAGATDRERRSFAEMQRPTYSSRN
jgi:hypothetical protein